MDKIRYLVHDVAEVATILKREIGEHVYAPLGVDSSATLNGFTLYFVLGCALYLSIRSGIGTDRGRVRASVMLRR